MSEKPPKKSRGCWWLSPCRPRFQNHYIYGHLGFWKCRVCELVMSGNLQKGKEDLSTPEWSHIWPRCRQVSASSHSGVTMEVLSRPKGPILVQKLRTPNKSFVTFFPGLDIKMLGRDHKTSWWPWLQPNPSYLPKSGLRATWTSCRGREFFWRWKVLDSELDDKD